MSVVEIPLEKLFVSPLNVRKTVDGESIVILASAIKELGLLNPITVRKAKGGGDSYEIIAGQRRFLALTYLNSSTAKCIIRNVSDVEALSISLDENEIRQEMGARDTVRAYSELFEKLGTVKKLAENRKASESKVRRYLSLQVLPDYILHAIDAKGREKISLDFAEQLAKIRIDLVPYVFSILGDKKNAERTSLVKKMLKEKSLTKKAIDEIVRGSAIPAPSAGRSVRVPDEIFEEVVTFVESRTGARAIIEPAT